MNENIKFPDPTNKIFDKSTDFFRIESICVNRTITEYVSHNNRFIELIAYINPNFGRVFVDPKWKVNVVTVDIKLKLFFNECMRGKQGIIEKFKALKGFENDEKYLSSCKKSNFSDEMRSSLEIYGINLPSLFQIFMTHRLLSSFVSSEKDFKALKRIRNILIKRYLKLIGDYKDSKSNVTKTEQNRKAFDDFLSLLEKFIENFSNFGKSSKIIKNVLQDSPREDIMTKFFSFYNSLSLSEDKVELFKYNITGDISIYLTIWRFLMFLNQAN